MKTQLTIARQSKDANEDDDNDAATLSMFAAAVVVVVVSVANITHYN